MNNISIYIPRVESQFNAEFIAKVFDQNGIAEVSRVYIEPYKPVKNNSKHYNRAYVAIKSWQPTEAAYNFIMRLRNPTREARVVYNIDNWWPVYINTKPNKLLSNKGKLTVFEEKSPDLEEVVHIDVKKTALLRRIVAGFKQQSHNKDAEDFDGYLREMYLARTNDSIYL